MKVKNIGIEGIKPPKKSCNDKNCPWHGHIKIRGKLITGKIVSAKAPKTVIIEKMWIKYVPKYERYMRVKKRIAAHKPECIDVKEGDEVIIGETRPISKTKHFVVLSKIE